MPRYMSFAKYSPQAAAAAYKEGMVARRKVLEEYVQGLGGRIVDVYAVAEPQWDIVAITEFDNFPAARQFNHSLLTSGSGGLDGAQTYTLATFEEVDADRTSMPGYRPPGG